VYQDGPFALVQTPEGRRLAPDPVDAPFLRFVGEIGGHFESLTLFARVVAAETGDWPILLEPSVRAVELPDYGNLRRLLAVFGASFRTSRAFWRGLREVDTVWAFGPHPFELLLVLLARLRGKRVVLGVRQDTPEYFRSRLPSGSWRPVLVGIRALDGLNRLLARRLPATVVGEAVAARYRSRRSRVLAMAPSLVRGDDVVAAVPERDWEEAIGLLTVGRIDTEKNPLLLVEALAELERKRPGKFRLRWAGVGPLAGVVQSRAEELGIADRLELVGYVPFGPELLDLYRRSHVFVHVSLTEGVPQVLVEALASGTPIVATDVGSVGSALLSGEAGLLVPPSDARALVGAVLRVVDEAELRDRLAGRGLELARERTLEAEAERVAAFLQNL
jgi:glycosyltransferase involved in cell wall biosynthesis